MNKAEAIRLLGGTPSAAARSIGISSAAISLWPDELPPRIADRVLAALWRAQKTDPLSSEQPQDPAPKQPAAQEG